MISRRARLLAVLAAHPAGLVAEALLAQAGGQPEERQPKKAKVGLNHDEWLPWIGT